MARGPAAGVFCAPPPVLLDSTRRAMATDPDDDIDDDFDFDDEDEQQDEEDDEGGDGADGGVFPFLQPN